MKIALTVIGIIGLCLVFSDFLSVPSLIGLMVMVAAFFLFKFLMKPSKDEINEIKNREREDREEEKRNQERQEKRDKQEKEQLLSQQNKLNIEEINRTLEDFRFNLQLTMLQIRELQNNLQKINHQFIQDPASVTSSAPPHPPTPYFAIHRNNFSGDRNA